MKVVQRDRVLENVRARADQLMVHLQGLRELTPYVADVRGLGLMTGVELTDPQTGLPADLLAKRVQWEAVSRGLIIELGGRDDCVVRMLPPLNCSAREIDQAGRIIRESLTAALAALGLPTGGAR